MRLLTGDLAALFWLGLILVGLVAPAALLWLSRKKLGTSVVMPSCWSWLVAWSCG
jgi:formate-dependent nitrite reductase membrane component NrfD